MGVASLASMTVTEPWSAERVLALAPDPGAVVAGRRLATARTWVSVGHCADPAVLWGLNQGSAARPYQTVIDLTGPASQCSCPSRKFPCKHALGLLLLWVRGGVADAAQPAGFAAAWLTKRAKGTTDDDVAASTRSRPPDPKAAAKRAADRVVRVTAGLEELDQWLCDQIRTGLAGLDRSGVGPFEPIAARMVDAQAPGVASRLRRLPGVLHSGDGWHARLLEQYAQLRLVVRAHRQLTDLPPLLAAAVRSHVGYPTAAADVLATPGVRDVWSVLGQRDQAEERLTSRRIWLQGQRTGRSAVLLSYVPLGRSFDDSLVPGTSIDADLHFYPSGERALVGTRHGEPGPLPRLEGVRIAAALAGFAAALAADPWLTSRAFLLAGVVPVRAGERWALREDGGSALPIAPSAGDPWTLVACSGGQPVMVLGEWATPGFTPIGVIRRKELVRL